MRVSSRESKNTVTSSNSTFDTHVPILVNEHLCPARKRLLRMAHAKWRMRPEAHLVVQKEHFCPESRTRQKWYVLPTLKTCLEIFLPKRKFSTRPLCSFSLFSRLHEPVSPATSHKKQTTLHFLQAAIQERKQQRPVRCVYLFYSISFHFTFLHV